MEKKTMTLNLSEKEMDAVEKLAAETDMTKTGVMRQALRLYQMIHHRYNQGETMSFSGDPKRAMLILGPGFPMESDTEKDKSDSLIMEAISKSDGTSLGYVWANPRGGDVYRYVNSQKLNGPDILYREDGVEFIEVTSIPNKG